MNIQKYDTVIVGGGIAGLTAAVYLSKAGQKALLIEKNNEFGGLVSSFKRDGFHFEAGLRALESAGLILPMLEDLGIELNYVRSKVSVGIENEVVSIDNMNSISDYKELLKRLYPESNTEIDNFIKLMKKIMKHLDVLYGIENPVFKDLKNDKEYLFKKLLPWLPKFIFTVGKINSLNGPVEEHLEKVIKNQSLRDIISQHFFKGTPTFFALSYFSLYLDYFYPIEGVGKLVDAIQDKITAFNGDLKANTTIIEVDAFKKYVVDQNGEKYYYNHLIWAADLKTLYSITKTEGLTDKVKLNFQKNSEKILKSKGSESVFSLYLEIDLPLKYFGTIAHGHFFYTPSKRGLDNIHRSELESLYKNWEKTDKNAVLDWFNRFLELNTFEISIPGLKNEKLVPENKTGMIISFICEYELFEKIETNGWYEEFISYIENKIIQILSKSIYPELNGKIMKQFSFTPISIKKRVASSEGAIVGWSFEKPVPVLNKINKSNKSAYTPIPTIFQAGQWAYSPAGVPMSILTGKIASDIVLKKSRKEHKR